MLIHSVVRVTVRIAIAGPAATILLHASWNAFAPRVFGVDIILMPEAFGMVLFASVLGLLLNTPLLWALLRRPVQSR